MTSHQTQLVQNTFGMVAALPVETVGSLFYDQLFSIAPEVRPLFSRTTTPEQSRKLLVMLAYVVARLDNPDSLVADLTKLAQRHIRYGVKERHYDLVGEALLWTLEQGLGNAWTEETKNAWVACYTLLATIMLRSSYEIESSINV
ncbi:globin family protein [Spirosoma koreense]